MRVILFGASGMVGQGVLRECLLDAEVAEVVAVVRAPLPENAMLRQVPAVNRAKLREIVKKDQGDLRGVEGELTGFDACFFSLGVSAVGMSDAAYRKVAYDLTLRVAETLARLNPGMTFEYVSGAGTNSESRQNWARVKGEAEDALLRLPFKAAYMFRPGMIQPMHGISSKTGAYNFIYVLTGPFLPLLRRLFPNSSTTTEHLGKVMLRVAKQGYEKPVLEMADISGMQV